MTGNDKKHRGKKQNKIDKRGDNRSKKSSTRDSRHFTTDSQPTGWNRRILGMCGGSKFSLSHQSGV